MSDLAHKYNRDATGFKLSDTELTPIRRVGGEGQVAGTDLQVGRAGLVARLLADSACLPACLMPPPNWPAFVAAAHRRRNGGPAAGGANRAALPDSDSETEDNGVAGSPPAAALGSPPAGAELGSPSGRKRGRWGKPSDSTEVLGPAVECGCETDIFRALGLAYVPLRLRELI